MNLFKGSKLIKEGQPSIFLYPSLNFTKEENNKSIKIILFGEAGSGKSGLLNCIVNAVMKVKFEDPFRYVIKKKQLIRKTRIKLLIM